MSSAADRLRLKRRMGNAFEKQEPARRRFRATIGDGAGNVRVPGKKNHVYMRRQGRSLVEEVLNVEVPARSGMPVICGADSENPDMLQVLAVDWQSIKEAESFTYLPMHHESHELLNPDGGDDVVWVQKTQIVPLAPFPTSPASMQIWVQSDYYPWAAGWNRWPGDLTVDLSTYLPAAYSGVYVLVSIDGATNALQYTAGTEYPYWPPAPEEDAIPAAPSGSVPIVAVYLWAKANLLTNDPGLTTDSFETPGAGPPVFLYWDEVIVGAATIVQDNAIFYAAGGGLNSCQITEGGGGRDTYVYQDFLVTAGSCYQLRFQTRDDGTANDGAYRIYDVTNGADIVATTGTGVVGGPAWDEITQVFTAPAGCTTARVYFYCPAAAASQAWYDDVTVAEVPCSVSWDSFRDLRLVNSPMPGSVAPMPDAWTAIGAAGGIAWQPDTVARLRAGVVTEYADPDDAFTAADTAGDVVLIPPGTWAMTAAHVQPAGVSVIGIGNPQECVLSYAADVGAIALQVSAGTASNFSVVYAADNAANRTAVYMYGGHAYLVEGECTNAGAGDATGIAVDNDAILRHCRGSGVGDGVGDAWGIRNLGGQLIHCEGYANKTLDAGTAGAIYIDAATTWQYHCFGETGSANGNAYGLYVLTGAGNAAFMGRFHGHDVDIVVAVGATLTISDCQYDTTSILGTLTVVPGDRAAKQLNETITGVWTFDEEITQAEQAADPGGPGAGYARIYPKDDGGQSKYYFMDDAGEVYEIADIVEDLTVTVQAAGGDFTVIQDAIDWFKHWIVKGDCVIDVEANTYDELLDFSDTLIIAGSTLTVEGDTRLLAGMSFFDGVMSNREGLNNAIAGTTDGVISLVGNGGQPVITVTNAGANNPDFDADAWVSGDKVLVYEWAAGPVWTATEYTIDSVLNNAITLTGNLVNGGVSTAGVGDDGAGITLLPNRRLESTVAGTAVLSDGVRGPQLDGFYVEPNANTDHGVNAKNGGMIVLERVVVRDAYFGIFADWINALVDGTGRLAAWECTAGTVGLSTAIAKMRYLYAIECIYGHWTERQAYSWPNKAVAINCTDGFRCERQSYMYPYEATARHCTMGYRSVANAMNEARQTGNQNNGNTADYLPLPAGAGQYAEDANNFGVLFYSM